MPHNDPEHINAWQRLDERTTTSGRLVEADIDDLAAIGVAHVINLAPDDKPGALPGEAQMLARHGIRYTYIPVPFDAPTDAHFTAFSKAYESSDEPVHVHCIMNYRVSAFFYRYNRTARGMDEREARALMEQQWTPETSQFDANRAWSGFVSAGPLE